MAHIIHRDYKTRWRTPDEFFHKLHDEFGFVTDVAASNENSKCVNYYDEDKNALSFEWPKSDGPFWMNPPYGRGIGEWVKKAWEQSRKGSTVVCLIPAGVDTKWFHDWVLDKAEIRFIKGRINFLSPDGSKPKNQNPGANIVAIYRPKLNKLIGDAIRAR